jgi:MSHA biogenesis protein MshO
MRRTSSHNISRSRGFTLIELVVTMTVSVVVVSFVSMFISAPVTGFMDQSRRARLVDAADSALSRMKRDVRRALPNSIRTASSAGAVALELLSSIDGARYRAQPPGTPDQILDLSGADASFNVIGPFTQVGKPFSSTSHYIAIYNVGVPGADAYQLANVITPPGTQIDITADGSSGEDRVALTPGFQFAYHSPTQRAFLLEGPVTYLCDDAAGTMMRYDGYAIATDQSTRDSHAELIGAGATASLMTDRISGCVFAYTPGTAERAGLVSLQIGVDAQGESISLLSQVHVDNVP